MVTQLNDGTALLGKFTELMDAGNRCAALLYRDSLSPQQLEAFYRTMKSPWIAGGLLCMKPSQLSLSFVVDDATTAVEFVRDISMIAMAHGCSTDIELDDSGRLVKLVLTGITDPVRKVLISWIRGYVHADSVDANGAMRRNSLNSIAATHDVSQDSVWPTDISFS